MIRLLRFLSRSVGKPRFLPSGNILRFAAAALLLAPVSSGRPAASPLPGPPFPCRDIRLPSVPGNEIFRRSPPPELAGKRLGLIVNQTSRLPDGTPLPDALIEAGMRVTAVFTPEHGFSGGTEAGRPVEDARLRGIPVISLYGATRKPRKEHLDLVDAFVYDIQDVGTRFYTYISTLKNVLTATAEAGIPVYVLDRPNPLGGEIIEGPCLDPRHESFIGAVPVPVRYGMTVGELALMMKGEGWVPENIVLHVIEMRGWSRTDFWADTLLPWIPTSPNIPTADSALAFPGTGLLGGIILNQGLGTPHPFLQIGAPWLDPEAVGSALPEGAAAGIRLDPVEFVPRIIPDTASEPPYAGRSCRGFRLGFTNRAAARPVRFALELIRILKRLYPERIYTRSRSLTLMYGRDDLERFLKGEVEFDALTVRCDQDREAFRRMREPYLLYR